MPANVNRRTFLFGTAGLGAAALMTSTGRARAGDKVRLGMIGCGGQGEYNWGQLGNLTEDVEFRVLCDVDLARTANAAKRFPGAEIVQDFRRVIERNDIDAVVIATPDHWHAIPAVWAMQTGKHVYCEKPLARSLWEVRTMREVAKKQKVVTQMGTQIHAGTNYRRVVELIQAGAIGTVRRVDVWCEKQPSPGRRVTTGTPPPSLDYELWLGPAERMPYNPAIVPFHWRWWHQFAGGVLGDMGCHYMDLAHWALDLSAPTKVSATGKNFERAAADNFDMPYEMQVDYVYPAVEGRPEVQLTWWHGITGPRDASGTPQPPQGFRNGVLFHADKGDLLADYSRNVLLPEERYKDYLRPAPSIPDSIGHHREWIMAIKNGGSTTCNWDYSGALSEAVLLGNVAYRLGRPIEWDARKLKIKNVKEREWKPLVKPDYHGDWKLKS